MAAAMNIGGKAANLVRLASMGQRVPPFYVAGTNIRVGEIREGALVAVRSSAVGEDAAGASFAGIHESLLFVRDIPAAIEEVRASATSERALAYRREKGLPLDNIEIAVVVQEMIDAQTSGVVFTANPTTGNTGEIVISALFGLGEGLVSVGLDADTFIVQKSDLSISAELAEKSEAIIFDRERGHGTKRVTIENARSLTDDEVRELARASIAIENAFGRPQDIEFAFDAGGTLFILQSRPITTIDEYGPAAGNRILWDNSNIVESFSGPTSPMTFSVIRRAYAIVYRCFAEVMGIDESVVRAHRPVFENMLGLFRGQVFYNLLNWYALVRLFPGYDYNRKFMESMMGVSRSAAAMPPLSKAAARLPHSIQLLKLIARTLRNFLRIETLTADFERNFKSNYDRWSKLDLDTLKPHELMNLYADFEDKVLWHWRAPIINDFFVMIFYGLLKKFCGDGSLQNDLLTGEGGIESAEPAKLLLRLARDAKSDAQLVAAINAGDLKTVRAHPTFGKEIDRYLELYGFRCMNELKLEEHSLRDRPELLLAYIRNYLDTSIPDTGENEQRIRADAEKRAFAKLPAWKRPLFRYVLGRARLGVKNRENMRFARTRPKMRVCARTCVSRARASSASCARSCARWGAACTKKISSTRPTTSSTSVSKTCGTSSKAPR